MAHDDVAGDLTAYVRSFYVETPGPTDEERTHLRADTKPPVAVLAFRKSGSIDVTLVPNEHRANQVRRDTEQQMYATRAAMMMSRRPMSPSCARPRATGRAPAHRSSAGRRHRARAPSREPDEPHDVSDLRVRLAEVLDALEKGDAGIDLAVELVLLLLEELEVPEAAT